MATPLTWVFLLVATTDDAQAPPASNHYPADVPKRHIQEITAERAEYIVVQDGTMDGLNCRSPQGVWQPHQQTWESNPLRPEARRHPCYECPMESSSGMGRLVGRIVKAAGGLARRLHPKVEQPGMIGLPPSARGLTGRPAEITAHAQQLACEWEDVGEAYIQKRMRQLGIPNHEIGAPDYERGGGKRAFLSDETIGGSNGTGRRLFVDSGVLRTGPGITSRFHDLLGIAR